MRTLALALLVVPAAGGIAAPVDYRVPAEIAALAPGPDRELAQGICGTCHSLDYILTQPRPLPDPHAFWSGEVAKMRTTYGAPIQDADAKKIAEYLAATYGR